MTSKAKAIKEVCSVVCNSGTPWTVANRAPLSMGFPRQAYWSGLPFPSPGDLSDNPGTEPKSLASPALAGKFFTTSAIWEAQTNWTPKYLETKMPLLNFSFKWNLYLCVFCI